jgi:hypothetical protein
MACFTEARFGDPSVSDAEGWPPHGLVCAAKEVCGPGFGLRYPDDFTACLMGSAGQAARAGGPRRARSSREG